jgi:ubiquitin-protein ligase E3 C
VSVPVDLNDLRRNTVYHGEFNEKHPVIVMFWNVLESFTNEDMGSFLKFVTSCSRPPLLGFSELSPKLGISPSGNDSNRLPTSSTCFNMLKLPLFESEGTLRS